MKHVKKIACTLVLAALFCAMLAMAVSAADDGSIWLNTVQKDDTATVFIVTDATVTDGLVEITYDAETMEVENVVPDEAYVAHYSINGNEDGVIKIAWVAPKPYETNGKGVSPISVRFRIKGEAAAAMTGIAYDKDGNEVPICDALDTSELEKAIDLAEGLNEDKYTEDSFDDVEEALEEAKDVLENENATQEEVDAAAKKLNDAIAALVLAGSNKPNSGDSSNLARPMILAILAILGIAAVCAVYYVSNKRRQAR